jgi:PIN domain nuclease of toxin-antitoxin system
VRLLLDTHAFLWSIAGGKLSENARQAFLSPENELYLSAASYWEICVKSSLGKLVLEEGWEHAIDQELEANQIRWLPVEKQHCLETLRLPWRHRDSFDRLLIAQARHEAMTLLTADHNIQQYDVATLW